METFASTCPICRRDFADNNATNANVNQLAIENDDQDNPTNPSTGSQLLAAVDTNIRLDGSTMPRNEATTSDAAADNSLDAVADAAMNSAQERINEASATARNERIAARMRRMIADILGVEAQDNDVIHDALM